jgi:hypothetical protein
MSDPSVGEVVVAALRTGRRRDEHRRPRHTPGGNTLFRAPRWRFDRAFEGLLAFSPLTAAAVLGDAGP